MESLATCLNLLNPTSMHMIQWSHDTVTNHVVYQMLRSMMHLVKKTAVEAFKVVSVTFCADRIIRLINRVYVVCDK